MEEIKTIRAFDAAFPVIDCYFDIEPGQDDMTQELFNALISFDAFDGMEYTVINDQRVIVSDNAWNVVDIVTLDEFKQQTIDYIRSEII